MLAAEVSLYPMETVESDRIIRRSLEALAEFGLEYEVGTVSTRLRGADDEVWKGLRALFERARAQGGEVAMVATITNARP